jgi:hypothetical protein
MRASAFDRERRFPGASGASPNGEVVGRRTFLMGTAAGDLLVPAGCDRDKRESHAVAPANEAPRKVSIANARPGEDVLGYAACCAAAHRQHQSRRPRRPTGARRRRVRAGPANHRPSRVAVGCVMPRPPVSMTRMKCCRPATVSIGALQSQCLRLRRRFRRPSIRPAWLRLRSDMAPVGDAAIAPTPQTSLVLSVAHSQEPCS